VSIFIDAISLLGFLANAASATEPEVLLLVAFLQCRLQSLGFIMGTIGMGLGFQLVEGQWATEDSCEFELQTEMGLC
jgi:hypothetical protein